jgi:hypothetical protein
MTVRRTVVVAATAALVVSGTVLGLLWRFGVWEYMLLGHTDVRVIFWPSSVILTVGWGTTTRGILITLFSVFVNCVLYVGIALLLRSCIRWGRFRIGIVATCVSLVTLFVWWNTALVLTADNYCAVLFTVPYAHKSFVLPGWMWGPVPLLVWAISTLAAVVLWMTLLVRRLRLRRTSA